VLVILNKGKNLIESIGWKTEILRLTPQNDIATQSLSKGGQGGIIQWLFLQFHRLATTVNRAIAPTRHDKLRTTFLAHIPFPHLIRHVSLNLLHMVFKWLTSIKAVHIPREAFFLEPYPWDYGVKNR
jgi:hypothetical protein